MADSADPRLETVGSFYLKLVSNMVLLHGGV
jgi:hypothetical protein